MHKTPGHNFQNGSLALRRASPAYRLVALGLALVLMSGNVTPSHAAAPVRRVNAPHFDGEIVFSQTAIFWFGRVTSTENYADVRVGYNDQELYWCVSIFDRRLWYDTNPSPDTLTAWDAVTLYLNLNGKTGSTPTANTHRFDAQLKDWEPSRTPWQASFQGNGSGWTLASVPFTTESGYRWESDTVGGINNNQNNRGWYMIFHIPFASLGLAGPPPHDTLWGMAMAVHDRDDAVGTPIADSVWPETLSMNNPSTWGQLAFGIPSYTPPPAIPGLTVMIRDKLNGVSVPDAAVGGTTGNLCPGDSDYVWNQWGNANFAGALDFNIQNQGDIADWPCFAKYYVTFPLTAIPPGKAILSATLTLHQFGNAGDPGQAEPSLIQVMSVAEDWNEDELTWNNAPLALENVSRTSVAPMTAPLVWPGVAWTWDISYAVAQAYTAGQPLRLALYEADSARHSGKYFVTSDSGDWNAEGRPTLQVAWGDPPATIHKTAWPLSGSAGRPVTYEIGIVGSGQAFTVTDDLPARVSQPGTIQITGGTALYNLPAHRILWTGTLVLGKPMTLTFAVTPTEPGPAAVRNTAILTDSTGHGYTAVHVLIIEPRQIWLPLVLRD